MVTDCRGHCQTLLPVLTLCASCGTVYCNQSCLFVCGWVGGCVCGSVGGWVCYHDNWKLHASILTKLGL